MELPTKSTLEDQEPLQPVLFEMTDITDDKQAERGWELKVNGEVVRNVTRLSLNNERINMSLDYGGRPEGYDGWVIKEPGGAATMPYMIDPDGQIYVGVVEEYRPTMGEKSTLNIPRGMANFDKNGKREPIEQTALRELREETGFEAASREAGMRAVVLAEGLNPNSAVFDFSKSPKDGVSIFAVRVDSSELILKHDKGSLYYAFPDSIKDQVELDKTGEQIMGSRFIRLSQALKSRDMFTSAAAGLLMAQLMENGEYFVQQNILSEAEIEMMNSLEYKDSLNPV